MLDIHCDSCGRVLVGTRQIISMTGTGAGMRIAYVCWCGRPGVEVVRRSGARAHVPWRSAVAVGDAAA